MKPLLSVIVPVYNVEKYLDKCINSILEQTYKNLQIILVDDGSTDKSGNMCDTFAMRDLRVGVIHQENRGLARARWTGLEAAVGEYTIWVDSDDWIECDYFEKMISKAIEYKSDLVVAELFCDIGDSSTVIKNNILPGQYEVEDVINNMLYTGHFYEYGIQPHGVTKLFKTELLRKSEAKMDFRITIGEDAAVIYPYILICKSIVVTDICEYHYIQRSGSLTKKRDVNEAQKIEILISYLNSAFMGYSQLLQQLNIYRNYLTVLRDLSFWDEKQLLYPFGGLDKIAIYGAGGMGQNLYSYCRCRGIPVVAWIDKNFEYYKAIDMPVISLEDFKKISDKCSYLFIANTSESVTNNIKIDLINNGIKEEKIRWFSQEFLEGS